MKITQDIVGTKLRPLHGSWSGRDCALYALGIGAGQADALEELEFTTDSTASRSQAVYPTFGVIPGTEVGVKHLLEELGDAVDFSQMLHGEQTIEQLTPLPTNAYVLTQGTITAAWDKRNSTVIETVAETSDSETGALYCRSTQSLFFRGVGGWGGERGPSTTAPTGPHGEPDLVLTVPTRQDQALLYRLSGDDNPLHLDPEAAARAGFDRPILHGLCSYGIVGRVLLAAYAASVPARFHSLATRFRGPVYPGDTLAVEAWQSGGAVRFLVKNQHGETVLANGLFLLRE